MRSTAVLSSIMSPNRAVKYPALYFVRLKEIIIYIQIALISNEQHKYNIYEYTFQDCLCT